MILGPVFHFELTTALRRARYFVLRGLYGSALLFALYAAYDSFGQVTFGVPPYGEPTIAAVAAMMAEFFENFSLVQLLAVLLLGPAMAAGTIATERERRTIEYLFCSQLTNAEIVLSKLLARFIVLAMLLAAGLPILALATLLGGIAPEAVLASFVIALSTAVAVLGLAVGVSTFTRRSRDAVTLVYALLAAVLIIPPVLWNWFRYGPGPSGLHPWVEGILAPLLAANPLWIHGDALHGVSSPDVFGAWWDVAMLAASHALAASALVGISVGLVRRIHLRQQGHAAGRPRRRRFRLRLPMGDRPVLWKEVFLEASTIRLGLAGRVLVALAVLLFAAMTIFQFAEALNPGHSSYRDDFLEFAAAMGAMIGTLLLLLIAARAAASVTGEKERDTWVSLLSTPVNGAEIVTAKMLGSIWAVRVGFVVLSGLWALQILLDPISSLPIALVVVTLSVLAFYAAALGVSCSLRCRTSVRAMGLTLGVGAFFGGGYLFCCLPLVMMGGDEEFLLAGAIPFLLAVPPMSYWEYSHWGPRDYWTRIAFAFSLGLVGYTVAAAILWSTAVATFDAAAGRLGGWDGPLRRVPSAVPRPLMVAEVVRPGGLPPAGSSPVAPPRPPETEASSAPSPEPGGRAGPA